jgi:glucose/arabinose dehydrogenase
MLLGIVVITSCTFTPTPNETSNETSSSQPSSAVAASSADASLQPTTPGVIADHLQIPWAIAFLPSGELLVTERPGTLLRIGADLKRHTIQGVRHVGEGGLLGITLHPDFDDNHWLYLYLTTTLNGATVNRVERYRYENDQLTDRTDILTGIPGAIYHDGGALAFGPDGYLYVTTGDATVSTSAQDTSSLAGKILRIRDDGSLPSDNPFGNAVYSYGHRNVQGIAWDERGQLWSTEHGRSGITSGYDELNRIEKGKNYGWPELEGQETREGMVTPVLHSGPTTTWAPASATFFRGSIFFGGLRGEALYEAVLSEGGSPPILKTHLKGTFGRIRAVAVGPDGMLYLTTSNTDGRGSAIASDDRIIKIDPRSLK